MILNDLKCPHMYVNRTKSEMLKAKGKAKSFKNRKSLQIDHNLPYVELLLFSPIMRSNNFHVDFVNDCPNGID